MNDITISAIECTIVAPTSGNEAMLIAWVITCLAALCGYALFISRKEW